MYQKGHCRVVSVGAYLPSQIVKPQDMVADIKPERFGRPVDLIEQDMGIHEVRHSDSALKPSDLAVAAAEEAIAKSGVNPDHIDVIMFTGIEGDYAEPSTAHYVQAKLGLKGICFDISNACLGLMSGIQMANDLIGGGGARYVLVCTGEISSNLSKAVAEGLRINTDKKVFQNRIGTLGVGDAGGAVILGPGEAGSGQITGIYSESIGQHADLCHYKMEGRKVDGQMVMGRITVKTVDLHKQVFSQANRGKDSNIACLVTHQVGKRLFDILSDEFHVPDKKMTCSYPKLGNITTATLPVNLVMAEQQGNVAQGDNIYMALSGSGICVTHAHMVA